MAVKKHSRRVYKRAVLLLIAGFMLLAGTAGMYVASAKSHSTVDVVHGLFTPVTGLSSRDETARIHAQQQHRTPPLQNFPAAGTTAGSKFMNNPGS